MPGGPVVPYGMIEVRAQARVVYEDVEGGIWLSECTIDIGPSLKPGDTEHELPVDDLRQVFIQSATHRVSDVPVGTAP